MRSYQQRVREWTRECFGDEIDLRHDIVRRVLHSAQHGPP